MSSLSQQAAEFLGIKYKNLVETRRIEEVRNKRMAAGSGLAKQAADFMSSTYVEAKRFCSTMKHMSDGNQIGEAAVSMTRPSNAFWWSSDDSSMVKRLALKPLGKEQLIPYPSKKQKKAPTSSDMDRELVLEQVNPQVPRSLDNGFEHSTRATELDGLHCHAVGQNSINAEQHLAPNRRHHQPPENNPSGTFAPSEQTPRLHYTRSSKSEHVVLVSSTEYHTSSQV